MLEGGRKLTGCMFLMPVSPRPLATSWAARSPAAQLGLRAVAEGSCPNWPPRLHLGFWLHLEVDLGRG